MISSVGSTPDGARDRNPVRLVVSTASDLTEGAGAGAPDLAIGRDARVAPGERSGAFEHRSVLRRRDERARHPRRVTTAGAGPYAPATSHEAGGYRISGFTREDAADIPGAFEAVYGRDYLNPLVYDADAFADLVASGEQISFVARDAAGEFAGHLGLSFSAPSRRLVEVSQGIVVPGHRKSGIFARLIDRAIAFAREVLGAEAVYGQALTNHTVSQRVLGACDFHAVGLEVDYVPRRMLLREKALGPAATLIQYLDLGRDQHASCHLPPCHAAWFGRLLDGAGVPGLRVIATEARTDRRPSLAEAKDIPGCDMSRLLVRRAGPDLERIVEAREAEARRSGRRCFQVLVNLGNAAGAAAVESLRGRGYACGGLLPGFLEGGQHVAIMYRNFETPYFEGVMVHDREAEELLAAVVADWQRLEGRHAGARPGLDAEPGLAQARFVPLALGIEATAQRMAPSAVERVAV
jgi:hypothetical protein